MDGNLKLIALSPRHLEACAAKTCQVLIEGEYNGVLIPGIHYIELKKDFSNIKAVFNAMKDESLRLTIIERAYRDIVESKKYSYATYTNFVIEKSLANTSLKKKSMSDYLFLLRNKISHSKFWSNKKHRYLNASINA